jgi:hypothetical protein
MRFFKMRWVKVTGLFLLGLLPAILIIYFDQNPNKRVERDSYSESSKIERWKNSGGYADIIYRTEVKWGVVAADEPLQLEGENWILIKSSDSTGSDISWDVIRTWKEGKPLTLAYSRAEGVMLIDPVTKKIAHLWRIRKDHPIDAYLEQELSKPSGSSTQGMVEANDRAIDLWELEIKRIDDEVLSKKYFTGEVRENYLKLVKARNEYIETMCLAISDGVNFAPNGGTITRLSLGTSAYRIVRDAAMHAVNMANHVDDFESPGNNNPRRE